MAKRYVRTVRLERCAEHEIDLTIGQLAYQLAELSEGLFPKSHNWVHVESENAVFELEVSSGAFRGQICADKQVDVVQQPGTGSIRKHLVRVSAECCNTKRKGARQLQLGMQHKIAALCGVVGGAGIAVVVCLAQLLAFEAIHIPLTLLAITVGSVVCAGVGSYFGGSMGGAVGKLTSHSSAEEEDEFSTAEAVWEEFIVELANVVDEFAQDIEESPSTATII